MMLMRRSYRAYIVKTNPAWAFVPHPGMRGLYVRTHACVPFVVCPDCKAPAGVPCHTRSGRGEEGRYIVGTHWRRRQKYSLRKLDTSKPLVAVEIDVARFASRVPNGL